MTATWHFLLRYSGAMCFSWPRAPIHLFRASMIRPMKLLEFLANTAFFLGKMPPAESGIPYRWKATPGAGGRIGWF